MSMPLMGSPEWFDSDGRPAYRLTKDAAAAIVSRGTHQCINGCVIPSDTECYIAHNGSRYTGYLCYDCAINPITNFEE